jgi:formylmethanofuran dehydrogenase subunit B
MMMKTKFKMEIQRYNNGTFDRILIFVDARKTTTH